MLKFPRFRSTQNMIGFRFNRLLIVRRMYNQYVRGHSGKYGEYQAQAMYECLCDCGKKIVTSGIYLRRGDTRSCGCLQKDKLSRLPHGIAGRNQITRRYERDATKRGLTFVLTKDQLHSLLQGECHYCGAPPQNVASAKPGKMNGSFIYSGVDRKDNCSGYTEDNCVSCCKRCNLAKRTMSYEEFKSWLTRAALWIQKGNNHGLSTTAAS